MVNDLVRALAIWSCDLSPGKRPPCRFGLWIFPSASLQGGSECESPSATLGVNSRCPRTAEHRLRIVNGRRRVRWERPLSLSAMFSPLPPCVGTPDVANQDDNKYEVTVSTNCSRPRYDDGAMVPAPTHL